MDNDQLFEASEEIARGNACPVCNAEWKPLGPPFRNDGSCEMVHDQNCDYWNELPDA